MGSDAAIQLPQSLVEAIGAPEAQRLLVASAASRSNAQSLEELSDEGLLQAVGTGSKDALGILFRRHGRAVLNVAWRILRDESEADDLRQEVFLYLFERAGHYEASKCSASSWIIQITYHRAIDRQRFLRARQHYKSEQFEEQRLAVVGQKLSTDQIDGKVLLERLRSELTTDQQQTLELHFLEGYSFREIADQRGQTIGNIRHHYYRALDRLRTSIFSKKRV